MNVIRIVSVHMMLNLWLWIHLFRKEKTFFFLLQRKQSEFFKVNFTNSLWIRWIIDLVASQMLPLSWTWFGIYLFRSRNRTDSLADIVCYPNENWMMTKKNEIKQRAALNSILGFRHRMFAHKWFMIGTNANLHKKSSSHCNTTSHLIWEWFNACSHEQNTIWQKKAEYQLKTSIEKCAGYWQCRLKMAFQKWRDLLIDDIDIDSVLLLQHEPIPNI